MMKTIQVVIDSALLRAADRAARAHHVNRSQLFRAALREHLRTLRVREREELDRAGYAHRPQSEDDLSIWEQQAEWPRE